MLRTLFFVMGLHYCLSGTSKLRVRETRCDCGVRNGADKHLGMGENVEFAGNHAWPWMAAIVNVSASENPEAYCGGTVINSQYIVTAAHCIPDMQTTGLSSFRVYLGTNFIINDNGDDYLDLGISEIKSHPKFDFETADYDIALIKVNDVVSFTKHIRPVCLRQPSLEALIGGIGIVTGWGSYNLTTPTEEELKENDVSFVQIMKCQKQYSTVQIPVTSTMLCAAHLPDSSDPCKGDSGGPLIVQDSKNRFTQVGIISHGQGCDVPDFPTIFSRMSVFIDWIMENTQDALYCRGTF